MECKTARLAEREEIEAQILSLAAVFLQELLGLRRVLRQYNCTHQVLRARIDNHNSCCRKGSDTAGIGIFRLLGPCLPDAPTKWEIDLIACPIHKMVRSTRSNQPAPLSIYQPSAQFTCRNEIPRWDSRRIGIVLEPGPAAAGASGG